MNLLFLDFEVYHNKKDKYDLRDLSLVEFVRDGRFSMQGMGLIAHGITHWVSANDVERCLRSIDWPNTAVVAHNNKFDSFILAERYGIVAGQYIDTRALAKAVLGKTVKGHSLKTLAEHFGLPPKGELKTDGKLELTVDEEKELATYCLHDVELCREIYNRLIVDFPQSQLDMMDWTIRTFVQPKLWLNVEKLEKAAKEEAERRENIIQATGIPKSVFSSNPKFAALLKEKGYEVPTKKSPRTGEEIPAFALGDVGFLELRRNVDQKLNRLVEARIAAKSTLLETRATSLAAIGKTGAWPFDVEFSGANQTHRFSGGGGAGGNPQNFTRGSALRHAVEAPEGHKLVVGDFAQIEARLVAYLSKDPGLIDVIENKPDLYCDFGTSYFGRSITKADDGPRRFSKCAILGLGYNMGVDKFIHTVQIQTGQQLSDEEGQRAVQLYRRKYNKVPALWQWLDTHIEDITGPKIRQLGTLPIDVGRNMMILPDGLVMRYANLRYEMKQTYRGTKKAWVYDVWDKSKTKMDTKTLYGGKLLENICQALAGVLCREVIAKFYEECVGQCHDEVILSVPQALAPMYAGRLKAAMETKPYWMDRIKLVSEVHVGKNWGMCK